MDIQCQADPTRLLVKKIFCCPKEDIFLTTFYGLYFSSDYTCYKFIWASEGSFHVLRQLLSL